MAGAIDPGGALAEDQRELTLPWMEEVTKELQRLFQVMRTKYEAANLPRASPEVRAAANLAVEDFARYHEDVMEGYRNTVVFTREAEIEGRMLRGRLEAYEEDLAKTYLPLMEVPHVQVSPIGADPRSNPDDAIGTMIANQSRLGVDLNRTRGGVENGGADREGASSKGSGNSRRSTSTRSRASTVRSQQSERDRNEDIEREQRRVTRNRRDNELRLADLEQQMQSVRQQMALDEQLHQSKVGYINQAHEEQRRMIEESEDRPQFEYESIGIGLGDEMVGEQTRRWVDGGTFQASSTRIAEGSAEEVGEVENTQGGAPEVGAAQMASPTSVANENEATPPAMPNMTAAPATAATAAATPPTAAQVNPSLLSRLNKSVAWLLGSGGEGADSGGTPLTAPATDVAAQVTSEASNVDSSAKSFRTTAEDPSIIGSVRGTKRGQASVPEQKHVSIKSPTASAHPEHGRHTQGRQKTPAATQHKTGQGRHQKQTQHAQHMQPRQGTDDLPALVRRVDGELQQLEQMVELKKREKEDVDMRVAIRNSLDTRPRRRGTKKPLASPILKSPPKVTLPPAPATPENPLAVPGMPSMESKDWPSCVVVPPPRPEARQGHLEGLEQLLRVQTQAAAIARMKEARPKEKFTGGKKWHFIKQMKLYHKAVEHDSLDDQIRVQELTHYFGGSAFKLIEAETLQADSSAALESAMNRLTMKFGMRQETPMEMMEEVMQGKPVGEKDPNALLDFYTKALSVFSFVKEEGRVSEFDSNTLVETILHKKLPHLSAKWSKKAVKHLHETGGELDFDAFLSFVNQEHCISELMQRVTKASGQQQKQQSYAKVASTSVGLPQKQKSGLQNAPTSAVSPSPQLSKAVGVKCPRCDAGHKLADCPVFAGMEVADRREFCKNIQACYRCMDTGHISRFCKDGVNCEKCQRQHHVMLHTDPTALSAAAISAAAAADAAAKAASGALPTPTGENPRA